MNKILKIALALLLALPVGVYADDNAQDEFDEFLTEVFVEQMESDYTTLHYQLRDYEALGIEKPEVNMGSYSWEEYEKDLNDSKEKLEKLESFDYASLSESQQHDYDTVHFQLERMIGLDSHPYFDFPFLPNSGVQSGIITTITEFVFYEKEDIDDYLTVLESIGDFMDDCLEITKKQAAEGYFMTELSLEATLKEIDNFIEKKEDNEFIIVFENNIDAFDGLTDQERNDYKERNKKIVLESVIPAYEKIRKELDGLRGSRKWGDAVADMPEGEEYFANFAKMKASSDLEIQEMIDLCSKVMNKEIDKLVQIMYMSGFDDEEEIDMDTPEEILEFLRSHLDEFPTGPEVTYTATYLDPSVATEGVVAYYLEPPVDFIQDNVVKINGDAVQDHNELYSTLAHEGFPGHLYQITWFIDKKPNLLRTSIGLIGYQEGWAMYAEDFMYRYMPLTKTAAESLRLNTSIGYIMNAAADLGVNGLGWTVDDLAEYLDGVGLNAEVADALYDYVVENPGIIIPYGVGLAQFLELRDYAIEELGDNFNYKDFHEVLMTYGDRPFETVKRDVEAYVESVGKGDQPFEDDTSDQPMPYEQPITERNINYRAIFSIVGFFGLIIALLLFLRSRRKKKEVLPYINYDNNIANNNYYEDDSTKDEQ